jgi:diguanylate cyclase
MSKLVDLEVLQHDIERIRKTRIRQFILVSIALFSLLSVVNFAGRQTSILFVMLGAILVLSYALGELRRNNIGRASHIVLWVILITITYSMWEGSGVRSAAAIGYPGAPLFALIMTGVRSFWVVYAGMLIFMTVLTWASLNGWREPTEQTRGYLTLIDYAAVLSAVTFVVRVLASDLLRLSGRLHLQMADVKHLADHDTLTGLPNRGMAGHFFEQMLSQSQRDGRKVALVFVDIDNFKIVNDTHGHHVGDELLQHLSDVINGQLRKSDRLVRIAGDEFLILLPGIDKSPDIGPILQKIGLQASQPVVLDGIELTPTLSMGVALAPDHGTSFRELMALADSAMYQAKAAGRNCYQLYQPAAAQS